MARLELAAGEAARRGLHDLELGDRRLAQPLDFLEPLPRRGDDLGEGAESREQGFRQRLAIAARNGAKQNELEQLVVRKRRSARFEEALAQPHAMSGIVRRLANRRAGTGALIAPDGREGKLGSFRCAQHAAVENETGTIVNGPVAPANRQKGQTGRGQAVPRGLSSPLGDSVKISTPVSVTATVCSYWAESERSRVTAVQPSESTFTCGRPRLIIGSTVKNMPGRSTMPSPGRPTCTMLGSSWNRRPTPWPQKSRTTLMCCGSTKFSIAQPMSPAVPPGRTAAIPRIIASKVTSISRSARRGIGPTGYMRLE